MFAGRSRRPAAPSDWGSGADGWGPRGVRALVAWRAGGPGARDVGWSVLLEAVIEHVEVGGDTVDTGYSGDSESSRPLFHRRGRYLGL